MNKLLVVLLLSLCNFSWAQNYKIIIGDTTGMIIDTALIKPYDLDLDQNGVVDFKFNYESWVCNCTDDLFFHGITMEALHGNKVAIGFWSVDTFNLGDTIRRSDILTDDQPGSLWFNVYHRLIPHYSDHYSGYWSNQTKYLAFFNTDYSDTLYGWMKIRVGAWGKDDYEILETAIQPGILTSISNLDNPHENQISVYPNPAQDVISLEFDKDQLSYQIIISDLMGRVWIDERTQNSNNISINHLPKGIYIIQVKQQNSYLTSRFVKI